MARSSDASSCSASAASSSAPARAADTSFAASMISTYAARSLDRVPRSRASSITRRIVAAAASVFPCASRSWARPGWDSRPDWLASR
jgi:hypothetical protein